MPRSVDSPALDRRAIHQARRKKLLDELEAQGGVPGLSKQTSNLFRHRESETQARRPRVDLKAFREVLHVDPVSLTAEVEGMTPYEDLVDAVLPFGLMPPVVPELKTITLGGASTGVGIESSSFRNGFVHETIREMDILLPDGRILTCSREGEHADLFHSFPNSYGTLGYALKLTIPLEPVKPYVRLHHRRFENPKDFFAAMAEACAIPARHSFVDGSVHGPQEHYLTVADFVDEAPQLSDYTWMDIYWKSMREKTVDYLSVRDYIWRWDTDWFWCSSHFGAQHPLVRLLAGRKRLRSTTYWNIRNLFARKGWTKKLERWMGKREAVIQDVEIPQANAPEFLKFFHQEIGIRPIWVCPIRSQPGSDRFTLYPLPPDSLYLNFGFWDTVPAKEASNHHNVAIEAEVEALGGKKSLYSYSFYEEERFRRIYGGERYTEMKRRYDPEGRLPDLYQKCVLGRR